MEQRRVGDVVQRREAFATGRGHTLSGPPSAWLVGRPATAWAIVGAPSPEQVRTNVAAAGWRRGPEHRAALDAVLVGA